MFSTLKGIVILVKLLHEPNAKGFILVTLDGMVTFFKFLHS